MSNDLMVVDRPLTAADITAQVQTIQQVMKAVMKQDVHYGVIPGTQKNSLLKPGAEKILSTFRIAVDPQVEDLSTDDERRYRVTCRGILPSGEIVGGGVGECSTDEEKFRWRAAVCDEEFAATPDNRKRVKYGKKSGGFYTANQVRTVPADLANTVLKMAKKRAMIDLCLTATGASDIFTQDLEDIPEHLRDELVGKNGNSGGKPEVRQPQRKASDNKPLTEAQAKYFPEILECLTKIHGTDNNAKANTVEQLTTFKGKDGSIVAGVKDYRGLSDKSTEILAHKLRALAEKTVDAVELCSSCMEQMSEGACRNVSCPDGRPTE